MYMLSMSQVGIVLAMWNFVPLCSFMNCRGEYFSLKVNCNNNNSTLRQSAAIRTNIDLPSLLLPPPSKEISLLFFLFFGNLLFVYRKLSIEAGRREIPSSVSGFLLVLEQNVSIMRGEENWCQKAGSLSSDSKGHHLFSPDLWVQKDVHRCLQ